MKTEIFSPDIFKAPTSDYAPCYSWAWNAPVTREGIDLQLSDFLKAGIVSLCIIPFPPEFRPTLMTTRLSPAYLSKEYFELISYAFHRAAELGMKIWIYDEGGWPSGGACGHTMKENPEAITNVITAREMALKKGDCYKENDGTLAAFIEKQRIHSGYQAEKSVTVTEYFTMPRIENGNRVDYTNPSVTKTFINNTYEPYKAAVGDLFGGAVPLIFTDEPGQMQGSLPKGFFDRFEKEYGYDIRDRLYAVLDPYCTDETDRKARIDYHRLIGKLMNECTFRPLSSWCKKNGVAFGGHLDNEHVTGGGVRNGYFSHLETLRLFGVPGIDVIWDQIRYPVEDNSEVCEGIHFFPRIAPSAARQSGKSLALSETFSVYGESFIPNEVRFVIGYQAIRGINAFNFLSIPYGRDRLSALAMRPGFCPEKPGFFHLKAFNDVVARLSYLLRVGKPTGDTALYFPAADMAASAECAKLASLSYMAEGDALEARHVAFDIIDDASILCAEDSGDGLALGDAFYKHIIVPKCTYMPSVVYKKIEKYTSEGDPALDVRNPLLRTLVRKTDEGELWFFFNESCSVAKEHISLPEGKHAYFLDLSLGEMHATKEGRIDVSLSCGDIAVYLITDKIFKTANTECEFSISVSEFKPLYMDRFEVYQGGIRKLREDVPSALMHDLSAEITYEAHYVLPKAPAENEIYRFTLTDTRDTASIEIDGKKACVFGPSPMVATVSGAFLRKEGALRVTVANTASGEIAKKRAMIEDFYPTAEQGVYAKRKMYALEAKFAPPSIGTLLIEKLV